MLLLSVGVILCTGIESWAKNAPVISTSTPVALGREAIQTLVSRNDDHDPEVRALVADIWGKLGNRVAIPYLKKTITDSNVNVRINAAASLHKLGDVQGLLNLIDETKPTKTTAVKSPADELRRMARDSARARATLMLGELGQEGSIEALKTALTDDSGEVRDAAAVSLAHLGEGETTQFFEALKDSDESTRISAIRSLGLISRDGVDAIKKILATDKSMSVRAEAALALGSFKDNTVTPMLIAALGSKNNRLRVAAVRALSRHNEPASTKALEQLKEKSPNAELSLLAGVALSKRGGEADLSLAELTLAQNDPDLKALAIDMLSASQSKTAMDLLSKTMREDSSVLIRVRAAEAILMSMHQPGERH